MTIYEKLLQVQTELKAPKNQFNSFGNYKYRNCEDILEAVKPILTKVKASIVLSDEVVMIGERYYVRATATFIDVETGESFPNNAYAREEDSKKGMDGSQITGASSSYARKYALNGLLDIDDTKDSDTTNKGDSVQVEVVKYITESQINKLKELGFDDERLLNMAKYYKVSKVEEITFKQAEDTIKKQQKKAVVKNGQD